MTDLEKFVELYRGFGIGCVVNTDPEETGDKIIILCAKNLEYADNAHYTFSDKLEGYGSFFSEIRFDAQGKFIKQGFWE